MFNRHHGARHAALASLMLAVAAPAAASIVKDWNATALAEVRAGRLGPPIVARALAITHTCMYDAWSAYDATAVGTALDAAYRRPASEATDAAKATAISHAAYRCLLDLFPAGAGRLTAAMRSRGYDPNNTSTHPGSPVGIGNLAAAAVLADRADDGANQYGTLRPGPYADYTYYVPRNAPLPFCEPASPNCSFVPLANPRSWQPLISNTGAIQSFIAPHWGNVRPFGFSSASIFDGTVASSASICRNGACVSASATSRSPTPQAVVGDSARYAAFVDEALAFSRELTPARKLVVEYWADGPASELPPGHWGLFAQFVSERDAHSIDTDVKMFFAMHNASMDAGIVAWYLKRKFDGVRPITAVRYLKQGQQVPAWGGPGRPVTTIPGERWLPYNPGSNLTPSFPGFISGHTSFSWASATVLKLFKVSDRFDFSTVVPADFGRVEAGVPPVPTTVGYATFSDAAIEAGLSRLWGGIHFSEDNDLARPIGIIAGIRAWSRASQLFAGYR